MKAFGKRITAAAAVFILIISITACKADDENNSADNDNKTSCEAAMILDGDEVNDGAFNEATWESIENFSQEKDVECKYYETEESTQEAYLAAIQKAVDEGAKIIVLSGSSFETTVYSAQTMYPEVYFLIIDGVPHDGSGNYATASNTISVIFAEEEAGYLAGYAAVKDGYTKLGFMGGAATPAVKRYGYGFVQGAAAAAAESETKIDLRYKYTGTFDESDDVKNIAATWYKEDTEVIFACGGAMNKSVIKAAEKNEGKVIGSDVDQSVLSDTVITSAKKDLGTAIVDILKSYKSENIVGAMAFNYAAKNDGVSLEIKNGKFNVFTEDDYNTVFKKLSNGKIELKKDTGVSSVAELAGDWVTIKAE